MPSAKQRWPGVFGLVQRLAKRGTSVRETHSAWIPRCATWPIVPFLWPIAPSQPNDWG
ncbi:MAG: hypothetical protein HN969_04930 [Verrucomicrobia bacterium]|nr:hypothetical protein [Verrucomicrobiota bacterium]